MQITFFLNIYVKNNESGWQLRSVNVSPKLESTFFFLTFPSWLYYSKLWLGSWTVVSRLEQQFNLVGFNSNFARRHLRNFFGYYQKKFLFKLWANLRTNAGRCAALLRLVFFGLFARDQPLFFFLEFHNKSFCGSFFVQSFGHP